MPELKATKQELKELQEIADRELGISELLGCLMGHGTASAKAKVEFFKKVRARLGVAKNTQLKIDTANGEITVIGQP